MYTRMHMWIVYVNMFVYIYVYVCTYTLCVCVCMQCIHNMQIIYIFHLEQSELIPARELRLKFGLHLEAESCIGLITSFVLYYYKVCSHSAT